MSIVNYLNLVRWKNLLMIIYIFIAIKYFLLLPLGVPTFFNDIQFLVFTLSVVLITASGYIINDIEDVGLDKINKPSKRIIGVFLSSEKAFNLYFTINGLGIILGFYFSYLIDHINFAFVYVAASLMLYQYSVSLKKILVVGNFTISLLAGLSIFIIALFDVIPVINKENAEFILVPFKIIIAYSIFAFVITFVREIVKDIEDLEGDRKFGVKSIALEFGIETTKKIVFVIALIPSLFIAYFSFNFLVDQLYSLTYVLGFVLLPLIFFLIKILTAKEKSDFTFLSTLLKFIMFTGISSIVVFTLILKYLYSV